MTWSQGSGLLVDVISTADDRTTVRLAGDFDIVLTSGARNVINRLVSAGHNITVDMSRITFLDAAGARFLTEEQDRAQAAGGDLIVSYPSRPVRRVLELLTMQGLAVPLADADTESLAPGVAWACGRAVTELIGDGVADMATVQLADPMSSVLRIVAHEGFRRRFLDFFELVHDEESSGGMALAVGRPVWVPDVAESPIFAGTPSRDVMLEAGSRSVASVPAKTGDGSVIVVSAYRRKTAAWTEPQRHAVDQAATATVQLLSR
jgi:anti-anti-sigma factor